MTRRKSSNLSRKAATIREERIGKLLRAGWIVDESEVPEDAIPVDPDLVNIGNSYYRPVCYVDRAFKCQDCGSDELWKAEDQQWFYETTGSLFYATAIRCRACRQHEKERKEVDRKIAGHPPRDRSV
ncbi:MAG: zinc-ribbon domain containing protein [Akkermansiaceae bacterium]